MDESIIAVLGLLVSALVAVAGGFSYMTSEMRKIATLAKYDTDRLRESVNSRIDAVVTKENNERIALRGELTGRINQIESELRSISERAVRRTDLDAVESRLTRGSERASEKIELLTNKVMELLRGRRQDGLLE